MQEISTRTRTASLTFSPADIWWPKVLGFPHLQNPMVHQGNALNEEEKEELSFVYERPCKVLCQWLPKAWHALGATRKRRLHTFGFKGLSNVLVPWCMRTSLLVGIVMWNVAINISFCLYFTTICTWNKTVDEFQTEEKCLSSGFVRRFRKRPMYEPMNEPPSSEVHSYANPKTWLSYPKEPPASILIPRAP